MNEQKKRIPSLQEYLKQQEEKPRSIEHTDPNNSSVGIDEGIDTRYLQIKIKNVKSDLDAAVEFFEKNSDKTLEYIDDCINVLKELKKKL